MRDERRAPAGVDLTTPNTARIYDYLLGGKDHYAADREVAERLLAVIPEARTAARENHAFIGRAVRFLAAEGVRQFIDIGTKLPARGNVHEVAAEVAPDAVVVFADGDPVVLAHARALLAGRAGAGRTAVARCDPRRPADVFDDPAVRALIDPDRPVACILDRVLHFIDDDAEAAEIVGGVHDALPPGGHLVFTHITQDPEPESGGDVGQVFKSTTATSGAAPARASSTSSVASTWSSRASPTHRSGVPTRAPRPTRRRSGRSPWPVSAADADRAALSSRGQRSARVSPRAGSSPGAGGGTAPASRFRRCENAVPAEAAETQPTASHAAGPRRSPSRTSPASAAAAGSRLTMTAAACSGMRRSAAWSSDHGTTADSSATPSPAASTPGRRTAPSASGASGRTSSAATATPHASGAPESVPARLFRTR